MKRGSSVLQRPSDAATHTHTNTNTNTHTRTTRGDEDAAGSSPFPAATSLFSPDVSTKMASDLLIRLSEATQKAQMHPGRPADEPGLALSPDGPGASPEPPTLSHTREGNANTDTLASDMLRKLAERQEVSSHMVRVKEEEEPMEVDLVHHRPITAEITPPSPKKPTPHLFKIKTEDQGLRGNQVNLHPGAKKADQCLNGLKKEDNFYTGGGHSGSKAAGSVVSDANKFQFKVKLEDHGAKMADQLLSGAKMEDQLLLKAKIAQSPFPANTFLSGVKMEDQFPSGANSAENQLLFGAKMENRLLPGAKMADHVLSGVKKEEQLFFRAKMEDQFSSGAKMEDQFSSGAKMADQCLRAALWQDMSVNLASTLLHQLSERVSKSNGRLERTTPTFRSSPVLPVNVDPLLSSPLLSSQEPPHETKTSLSRDQTTGCSYFYRCHVCGFETDGRLLFQSHMTEHRQWERGSFSLHCCVCDHSTNQEAEMRVHANTHTHAHTSAEIRCPVTSPPTSSTTVSVATTSSSPSSSEHRCRICQRSFPGQQELLVHFQGHRQGNQYRCERCGHLTRTANKLVEHVRVHTGERPFTCTLCSYSAKRRDSLRLHCKVKHPEHTHTHTHTQRLHTHTPSAAVCSSSSSSSSSVAPLLHPSLSDRWRDLSPLLPITTLLSLKPRAPSSSSSSLLSLSSSSSSLLSPSSSSLLSPSSSSSSLLSPSSSSLLSSSSSKHSFLSYLGLKTYL
ncbi:hypothetical protein OYC64_001315 [Pagothenia borchgrevinki]|uniref:C2H2-type domain-containing protein n=1 Tax=Pagothenia borchgrevinki TaxID=8213 RepID=A0ABD2GAJ4_PAGBO